MAGRMTVIGAGAAGCVTAAYLVKQGQDVVLCDLESEFRDDFLAIRKSGIQVDGPGFAGEEIPKKVTCDIESAMESEIVLVCVSAPRQEKTALWMKDFVRPEHKIFLMPGNLGALVFHRIFQQEHIQCDVLAEISECFWACRKIEEGKFVSALPVASRRIAAVPYKDTLKAERVLSQWFPVSAGNNMIENMLNSPNVLTHLAGTLLNIGEIEKKRGSYALFMDGLGETYLNCLDILEKERGQVLEAFGMNCYCASMRPFMNRLNHIERFPELKQFKSLTGPDGMKHRYITEDAMCGVALLVSMAEQKNVPIPVTAALLDLASALTQTEYREVGRTIKWIGADWDILA